MGSSKLLKRLGEFFDLDASARRKQAAEMKQLLKKLKKKERNLLHEYEHELEPELKQKLKQKVDILHAQRKKGLAVLKELKGE